MLSLKFQRCIFFLTALLALILSQFLTSTSTDVEILVLGALILFLGVPHGALDVLYLRKVLGIRSVGRILVSLAAYLLVSAGVVYLWIISPLIFLTCFLAASAFHFSGDPDKDASVWMRLAGGCGVVVLPSIFHGAELTRLYGLLTNHSVAKTITAVSIPLGYAVLAVGGVAIFIELYHRRLVNAAECLLILVLATFATPLMAFTVYFCLMHSARHIIRTGEIVSLSRRVFALECLLPMIGVALAGVIGWKFQHSLAIDAKVIQILFVSLAALTAPHMIIVEPIRFRGWKPAVPLGP